MAIKRIAASYVYTLESAEPLKNGFVEYDDNDGTILRTGVCENPDGEDILDGLRHHDLQH